MIRHVLVLLTSCAALAGCATAPSPERRAIAWDGLGRDPNRPAAARHRFVDRTPETKDPNLERERVLATLRPYSSAWWAVHDEIEAENERQLGTKLVICRRCLPTPPNEDVTGSIR